MNVKLNKQSKKVDLENKKWEEKANIVRRLAV